MSHAYNEEHSKNTAAEDPLDGKNSVAFDFGTVAANEGDVTEEEQREAAHDAVMGKVKAGWHATAEWVIHDGAKRPSRTRIADRMIAACFVLCPDVLRGPINLQDAGRRLGLSRLEIAQLTASGALDKFVREAGLEREAPSLTQIAKRLGFTCANISPYVAEFSRAFGIRCRAQSHDWRATSSGHAATDVEQADHGVDEPGNADIGEEQSEETSQ